MFNRLVRLMGVTLAFGSLFCVIPARAQNIGPIGGFKVPPGWKLENFAAEPQMANPVAFCIDEKGRVYVAEEFRFNRGTEENRTRPFLLEDDLQLQTTDDRLKMYKKFEDRFEGGMSWFTRHSDQVRLLEDRDGDGKADRSEVFAAGFNGPLDGLAAGVIVRDGDVYLTCIPNLWLLRDTNNDGKADVRKSLQSGFGVNAAFLGHDLHGLVWGPDGRLYFSVGDRGYHLLTREGKTLHGPRNGAVFRCEPDGSNLEVFATGLRNPQELAFDNRGNLFAADNNCDLGDHARLVYVMQGGHSGWNMSYQTLKEPYLTGPWHAEKLWHLPHPGQPAYIVPPVGKLGAGPSGFAAYPGLGLPARYKDHLFYCNFTSNGGVESFALKPKGAGFEMTDEHQVVTPVMATDVDFGYDGKMYLSEFGRLQWDGSNNEGRIYTVSDPESIKDPRIAQVSALFRDGLGQLPVDRLGPLLSHDDMRVRLRAQWALAVKGPSSVNVFREAIDKNQILFARLHGVWGLGQIARKARDTSAIAALQDALADSDADVRAQAAQALGDAGAKSSAPHLLTLLRDPDLHVRSLAAIAIGNLGDLQALEPLLALLRENADRDPFLRHAGMMGLLGLGNVDALLGHAGDASPAVRMAVLLVLRREADPRIAQFLRDADPLLVAEAARAINDVPIDAATPELAKLLDRLDVLDRPDAEPLARRAIHAAFRLGTPEQASRLARLASRSSAPARVRSEAVGALGDWANPNPRDRVNGFWRPLPKRDGTPIFAIVQALAFQLLDDVGNPHSAEIIDAANRMGLPDHERFSAVVADPRRDQPTRLAALRLLDARRSTRLAKAVEIALASDVPSLRAEGRRILSGLDPSRAFDTISAVLADPAVPVSERQDAIVLLGTLKHEQVDALLERWLTSERLPDEISLDVVETARTRGTPALLNILKNREASLSKADPLAPFRLSLSGGNAERGKALFSGHRQAQCIRCHAVRGAGGTAAPDLDKVATRLDRQGLLESLIEPDAKIAQGFGTFAFSLTDGRVITGVIKSESGAKIVVEGPDRRAFEFAASEVDERSSARSAMPKMGPVLTPRELRDVIEYLSTLR